jgi:hypothetical protein
MEAAGRLRRPPRRGSSRIAERDPDDWLTVALALTLRLPIWSQAKDLTSAGPDVFTTGDLVDAWRDAGHIE